MNSETTEAQNILTKRIDKRPGARKTLSQHIYPSETLIILVVKYYKTKSQKQEFK